MKNVKIKTPTFDELKQIILKKYPEDYNDFLENKKEILVSLKLLDDIPDFSYFLIKNKFKNYDLSTIFFAQIIYYMEECLDKNNIEEIKNILNYLNKLVNKGDEEIINLICVGFLENLDNYKYLLIKIIKFMPQNLKDLFMEFYSDYLD